MRTKNLDKLSLDRWAYLLRLAGVALVYALSVKLVLAYLTFEGNISVVWIPSGIGLAAVLLGGRKYWPAVFVGALAAYLLAGRPVLPSIFIAMSNVLEALLCSWLIRRRIKDFSFDPALTHLRDYFWMVLVAAFTVLLASLIGVMTLWLAGAIAPAVIPGSLLHWWMGDTLGIIAFTPFILVWRKMPAGWLGRERVLETIACFGFAFVFGQIIFYGWLKESVGEIALPYLMFLFVTWGALRFGRHGSLLIIAMTALQFLLGTIYNTMFYPTSSAVLWLYTMVLTVVGTTLALVMYERKHAETQLSKLVDDIAKTNEKLYRVAEERRTALDATSEALAAERAMADEQRQFVAMVSHEFRTPLAIIDAANQSLRVLIDQGNVEVSKRIDKIAQAMSRLKTLIDHTLSRERLKAGRLTAQLAPFDLGEWLQEQAKVAQLLAPLHRVTLTLGDGLANKSPVLSGDSHLLSVAWMNLVDNAAKFSASCGAIRLEARLDGGILMLEVTDAGPGIPAADLPTLFDKFVRGSHVQGIVGAGLGLYMVRCIAELHGGAVTVVNTDPGCRATLRLNLSGL